jgi:hypothetical protein
LGIRDRYNPLRGAGKIQSLKWAIRFLTRNRAEKISGEVCAMTVRTEEIYSNHAWTMIRSLLCVMVLALLAPLATRAQNYNGSITGIVSDPSGASIAGATVTAINKGTNETYTAKTSDLGAFASTTIFSLWVPT